MRTFDEQLIFANALNQIRELGPARFTKLRAGFGSFSEAWRAGQKQLLGAGLEPHIVEAIVEKRKSIDPQEEADRLVKSSIEMLLIDSPEYPELLRQIHNAPALLYYRGDLKALRVAPMIAIVGTRKLSAYGKQVAHEFAADLARAGACVVSGLAAGIDGVAHAAALEVSGRTVAVLGSGIDDETIYPDHHRALAQQIIERGGLLLSELPIKTPPLKLHFPFRNRIIAGLCSACIVVEADEKSGALITATAALDYNREVFAVPGSIYSPMSRGPNTLITQGARLARSAGEILEELGLVDLVAIKSARALVAETPLEEKLLPLLTSEPVHINALIAKSGLKPGEVASTLTVMELHGKVKNLGAMHYVKSR